MAVDRSGMLGSVWWTRVSLRAITTAGVEEPLAEADHELLDLADQRSLDVTLAAAWRDLDEVEHQRIARDLLDGLRFDLRETFGEVRECGTLGDVQTCGDVVLEQLARPAVLTSLLGVPAQLGWVADLVEEQDVVAPRQ
jgi:hypothetical protein